MIPLSALEWRLRNFYSGDTLRKICNDTYAGVCARNFCAEERKMIFYNEMSSIYHDLYCDAIKLAISNTPKEFYEVTCQDERSNS